MSKIILIDDDGTHLEDFATGTNTEPTILANSMEYEKFLQKETNSTDDITHLISYFPH
jgi:hypothetical protein